MTTYLAVDGGNSKTDAVVGTADGQVLACVRGGGTCHQNIGMPATVDRLRTLVNKARLAAGLPVDFTFELAEVFLAGADLPVEVAQLTSALANIGWSPRLRVDNDTLALLRVGTDALDAIAVVCGAGINCVGRSAAGEFARFPSLGMLSGDWGGGGHLASLALWHAVRGEDGRGRPTQLSAAVASHFGLPFAGDVGARVHLGELAGERITELTPLLFELAAAGDEVARGVVRQQAEEIASLATVAARRLDLLDSPFTVVLGGGVLRAQHPLLMNQITELIHGLAPKAIITVVDAPPVVGAALSALDALDASPEAHTRLRAAF